MKHDQASVNEPAINRAIRIAGGQRRLAELLGVTPQVVSVWRRMGRVPFGPALMIERYTYVPWEELCPGVAAGIARTEQWRRTRADIEQ